MFKRINLKRYLEAIIFGSKWLLIPFYLKLFWTLAKLMYSFFVFGSLSNEDLMSVLEDVDIVMIANLVKMIITGSYNSFVDKSHNYSGEHISSGGLKVKMATSVIGVSSIHLLKTFIDAANIPIEVIHKQILMHGFFIIGATMLALIDYLHMKSTPHIKKEED
jgi:uncharacterized protein (TIGR00645 family)